MQASATPTTDRAEIFATIMKRQALRREAKLPLLDVKTEYDHAVEHALWSAHVSKHYVTVRAQIVEELHAKHDRDFQGSVGGLWAIRLLTSKRLKNMFEAT